MPIDPELFVTVFDVARPLGSGIRQLISRQSGPFPKVVAASCALGAIYFGCHTLNHLRNHAETDTAEPRTDAIQNLAGLVISGVGFAGAVRLGQIAPHRRR